MPRLRPLLTSLLAWTVGAAAAVGVGLIALSLIRTGLTDDAFQPFSSGVVAPRSSPAMPAGSAPPGAAAQRQTTSAGGTVAARCQRALAYLAYWTPEPGFRAETVSRGPAPRAWVMFVSSEHEITVTWVCVGGVPQSSVSLDGDEDAGQQ